MLKRRSLRLEWIEDALRNPTVVKVDERDPTLKLAFRKIEQAGDRWLRVVYRMDRNTHVIVTAFLDRGMEN